jgi:hypothetical protein
MLQIQFNLVLVILKENRTKYYKKTMKVTKLKTLAFKRTVIENNCVNCKKPLLSFQTLRKSIFDAVSCFG